MARQRFATATVPPGSSYRVNVYTAERKLQHWVELMTEDDCEKAQKP